VRLALGLDAAGAAWAASPRLLICLFLIDWDTQILPDDLNYTLLWLGCWPPPSAGRCR
jgi:leader peptidase (prepilin peptidase)/N-methyltransferase